MTYELKENVINELLQHIKTKGDSTPIYIGIDVGKKILDVGIVIGESDFAVYIGNIENEAKGFKKLENLILEFIQLGIDENNIYFGTENTGIYGHDIMNYFDDRLPNTYILNSNLTCNARKYYAKSDLKSDNIDSIIVATTLRDLDEKHKLESINNPFKKISDLGFVRRSFSNERNSLRLLFRRLCMLRIQKTSIMTSINLSKERLFPELNGLFSIKHRSSSENLLLNNFSREDILNTDKETFLQNYKNIASKGQKSSKILKKVEEFYNKIKERGEKLSRSKLDTIMGKNSDFYLFEEIQYKSQHYQLISNEIKNISEKIGELLNFLKQKGCFIPTFTGINDIEIGVILGELGFDIYKITSKEFLGFIGRYPENYTSGGGHIVKEPKLSRKKGIIKKFVYIRMYGFLLHNYSFRLYKKLLTLEYSVEDKSKSTNNIRNKRKIEVKCGEKLLKIIHDGFKNKRTFSDEIFIKSTINPIINKLKNLGFTKNAILDEISKIYGNNIPQIISI